VSDEVVAEFAVGEGPDFDQAIPSTGDDEWHLNRGGEANTGDPFIMTVIVGSSGINGVLAFTEGIPELDGLISRSGDDLTVVDGEGDTEYILGVTYETTCGLTGVDFPKTEGSIPTSGECELSIGGDDNVGYEVVVSTEGAVGVSVLVGLNVFGVGGLVGEVPHEDGLIAGGGEDDVGVFGGGGDGGDPVAVPFERSA